MRAEKHKRESTKAVSGRDWYVELHGLVKSPSGETFTREIWNLLEPEADLLVSRINGGDGMRRALEAAKSMLEQIRHYIYHDDGCTSRLPRNCACGATDHDRQVGDALKAIASALSSAPATDGCTAADKLLLKACARMTQLERLCACYRTGRRPKESLLDSLSETESAQAEVEQYLAERARTAHAADGEGKTLNTSNQLGETK